MAEAQKVAPAKEVIDAWCLEEELGLRNLGKLSWCGEPPIERDDYSRSSFDEDELSDDEKTSEAFFYSRSKIPKGEGTKIGDIKHISDNLGDPEYLDFMHYIMFGVYVLPKNRIKHIKKFNGFEFKRDSPRYERAKSEMVQSCGNVVKDMCATLDLLQSGTRQEQAMRVLEFLMKPSEEATKTGTRRLRREATLQAKKRLRGQCEPELVPPPTPPCLLNLVILTNIFKYLDTRNKCRMTRVCKTWRDVLYCQPHLWREAVAIWYPFRTNNPTLLSSLIKRGFRRVRMKELPDNRIDFLMDTSDFTRINLSRWPGIKDDKVIRIVQQLPDLRSLSMRCIQITDVLLHHLANKVHTLKELDIRDGVYINDDSIKALVQPPDEGETRLELETLSLHMPGSIGGQSLRLLQCRMPSLTRLILRYCSIANQDLRHVGDMINLVELDLASNISELSEVGFGYLSIGRVRLVKLGLAKCRLKTEPGILKNVAAMTTLRTLNLMDCHDVTSTSLANLAEGGSNLASLILSGCDQVADDGVASLAKLANLRELNVTRCPLVSAIGLCGLDEQRRVGLGNVGLVVTGCEAIYEQVRPQLDEARFCLVSLVEKPKVVEYDFMDVRQFDEPEINRMVCLMFRVTDYDERLRNRNRVLFRMSGHNDQ